MPNKDEKAKLLNPVLPVFTNKLIGALGTPSGQHTSFALKTEIIKGTWLFQLYCWQNVFTYKQTALNL